MSKSCLEMDKAPTETQRIEGSHLSLASEQSFPEDAPILCSCLFPAPSFTPSAFTEKSVVPRNARTKVFVVPKHVYRPNARHRVLKTPRRLVHSVVGLQVEQ